MCYYYTVIFVFRTQQFFPAKIRDNQLFVRPYRRLARPLSNVGTFVGRKFDLNMGRCRVKRRTQNTTK